MRSKIYDRLIDLFIGGLVTPLVIEHQKAVWIILMLIVVGLAVGVIVFLITDTMEQKGIIKDRLEYWLVSALFFILLWFACGAAFEYANQPPVPHIYQYAPDGIHVEYK